MKSPNLPENELQRLFKLRQLEILDTPPDPLFDDFTHLAQQLFQTPIALISLIDGHRQWFKSKVGLEANETSREISFCGHAILQDHVFEVSDALQDPRFFDNPLVTNAPNIRFYAGIPLITSDGFTLGTLCIIDTKPRTLSSQDKENLTRLGRQVSAKIEHQIDYHKIQKLNETILDQYNFTNTILQAVPAGIGYWDSEMRCRFANKQYLDWFNVDANTMLGKTLEELFGAEFFKLMKPYAMQALKGQSQYFEIKKTNAFGQEGDISVYYIPRFGHQGEVMGYFSHVTDITKIKKTELAHKIARMAIDQASDGIMITDHNTNIISVNPYYTKITGYTQDELIGKTPSIFKSGRHGKDFYQKLYQSIDAQGFWQGEIWNKRKNGEIYPSQMSIDALKDSQGYTTHYVCELKDNTENYSVKNKLENFSTMLEHAGEIAKVGAWQLDLDTNQTYFSKQIYEIFEIDSSKTLTLDELNAFFISEALEIRNSAIITCKLSGSPWHLELPIVTAKNNHRWVLSNGEAIIENGQITKVTGAIHDITERKKIEDAKIANEIELRNTLVREVHHRIKNNLQGVSGILHNFILQHAELTEPITKAITQLQSVAMIHGLQSENSMENIEIKVLAESISKANQALWQINLLFNADKQWKPCFLEKNEAVPIALILNELTTNAIKHSDKTSTLSIQMSQDLSNSKITIRLFNQGKFNDDVDISAPSKRGLTLVSSLMPKKGAYLRYKKNTNNTVTDFELNSPVILFNLSKDDLITL